MKSYSVVSGLIIQNQKIILYTHNREDDKVSMGLPWAKLGPQDNMIKVLKNEVKDSIGLEIRVKGLLDMYDTETRSNKIRMYLCTASVTGGKLINQYPERTSDVDWYSLDELKEFKKKDYLVGSLDYFIDREDFQELFKDRKV